MNCGWLGRWVVFFRNLLPSKVVVFFVLNQLNFNICCLFHYVLFQDGLALGLGYLMLLGELNFWKIQPMKLSRSTDPPQKKRSTLGFLGWYVHRFPTMFFKRAIDSENPLGFLPVIRFVTAKFTIATEMKTDMKQWERTRLVVSSSLKYVLMWWTVRGAFRVEFILKGFYYPLSWRSL